MVAEEKPLEVTAPNCDPVVLSTLWDAEFESFGRQNRAIINELDRREDALIYADGALRCYRDWFFDMRGVLRTSKNAPH